MTSIAASAFAAIQYRIGELVLVGVVHIAAGKRRKRNHLTERRDPFEVPLRFGKGTLRILSSKSGTVIEASVPLTHMLTPQDSTTPETKASA